MTTLEKVLYTAKSHVTGGRDGAAKTDDGRLDVKLSSPGTSGTGTNPEQLFASGYAACFIGAMKAVGGKIGIPVPQDVSIDAEVDLGPIPNAYGIAGAAQFELPALAAGATTKLGGNFYVGPKEYKRLANTDVFKADQDKVMDYGFFGWASKLLITLMTWMHSWAGNWGIAIMLTTLALKVAFIPLTLASTKSMKRMAKLQPELVAIKEKFKDDPKKQQMATMQLFKDRKVNPVSGCLPQLLTIPFFMGFFSMLSSTAELRY
eukprot:gene957-1261_t